MSKPNLVEIARYAVGVVSVGMSLTLSDLGTVIGMAVPVLTLVVNGVFAYRRDRREQREFEARRANRIEPS